MTKLTKAQREAKARAEAAAWDAMTPEQRAAHQAEEDRKTAAFVASQRGKVTALELAAERKAAAEADEVEQAAACGMTLQAWKAEHDRLAAQVERDTDTTTDWG
jgi:hypothetical protein